MVNERQLFLADHIISLYPEDDSSVEFTGKIIQDLGNVVLFLISRHQDYQEKADLLSAFADSFEKEAIDLIMEDQAPIDLFSPQ